MLVRVNSGKEIRMKRHLSITASALAVFLSVAASSGVPAKAGSGGAPASLTCDGTWHIAPSDNPAARADELEAVAAVSPSLAWAVGDKYGSAGIFRTLIERWDGSSWTGVPSPNLGHDVNELLGVAAPDATYAFAVGERNAASGRVRTLIEQYDGAFWSIVPSPNRGPGASFLSGVAAVSSSDAWAVGTRDLASGGQAPLVEHWDGTTWSIVPSPFFHHSPQTVLSDVAVVSSTDVWAVGTYYAGIKRQYQPLAEHWNGTAWSIVPAADPGVGFSFSSLTALAANDVWAVGYQGNGGGPLAERWDGSSWSVVTTTNPGRNSLFLGVAAAGASVYATGVSDPGPYNTLAEKWNGASFQPVSTLNVDGTRFDNWLLRAASDGTTVWSVGHAGTHHGVHTLVEYVC
jgi:hypothetical protein